MSKSTGPDNSVLTRNFAKNKRNLFERSKA